MKMPNLLSDRWKYHVGRGANPRLHIQTACGYQIASTPELIRSPRPVEKEENEQKRVMAQAIAALPELMTVLLSQYKKAIARAQAYVENELRWRKLTLQTLVDEIDEIRAALLAAGCVEDVPAWNPDLVPA